MNYELIATSTFGLEAVVRREIEHIGCKVTETRDGKVTFLGDERDIVRANLMLRSADRVLIKMAEFDAPESEDLFQQVKAIDWERIIPRDGKFTVNCSTVKSKLRSEPNNQKTVKKAIVDRLRSAYDIPESEVLPETGAVYTVKVSILKDRATITLDTSGAALHKRGYRVSPVAAPLKETLASALIELSFFRRGRTLVDPCCGSGTIAIEAAMIARDIAPGINRHFASEEWDIIPNAIWEEERKALRSGGLCNNAIANSTLSAFESTNHNDIRSSETRIFACDIDPDAVKAARENAEAAGVADMITFRQGDIKDKLTDIAKRCDLNTNDTKPFENGIIITNPPYGERIGDEKQRDHIFAQLSRFMGNNNGWSVFLISPDKHTEEKVAGRRADRRRKLYNGNIEVCYYQFHGKKPNKNSRVK